MQRDKKHEKEKQYVIVFSADFIISAALASLQKTKGRTSIKIVDNPDELLCAIIIMKPLQVILDIPARDYTYLLCAIRREFPVLPLIITRYRHLFSDYITASWFGNIWLREYDALMSGYPGVAPTDCVTDSRFAGVEGASACRGYCNDRTDGSQILRSLRGWLGLRLRLRLSSRQGVKVIMNWLELGGSAGDVGKRMKRSDKLAYHYRRLLMKELNLRNTALEFIPSIAVKGGNIPTECASTCLLRINK
ncbi:hypothetical protein F6B50_23620 [Salmonella enterica]|nr:hypothetical protein [Salmonella enterica]EDC7605327.1 hypothetical protein [Salmonella enterica subsp. enterica serovar Newport]ECX3818713.1 hypothetical protein [Salmonella enterica]ECY2497563.1 hypothetical protein [Salmonella enterica]ECY2524656.1 hypothetical protein [Salmonella enterica]